MATPEEMHGWSLARRISEEAFAFVPLLTCEQHAQLKLAMGLVAIHAEMVEREACAQLIDQRQGSGTPVKSQRPGLVRFSQDACAIRDRVGHVL